MDPHARTLVAVMANGADQQTHTLYFNDGTVVGYDPTLGRVLRVHRLPADLGNEPEAVVDVSRRTPAVPLPALTDRRREARD